jgi:hypothetical protein
VDGYLTHKVNYHYCYNFLAWNLFRCLKELDSLSSQGQGDVRVFKIACFLENFLEQLTSTVVISEVDALVYVVLTGQKNTCLMEN